jgi:hypothetical protein
MLKTYRRKQIPNYLKLKMDLNPVHNCAGGQKASFFVHRKK